MPIIRAKFRAQDGTVYSADIELPVDTILTHHSLEIIVDPKWDALEFVVMPLYIHGTGYHTVCSRMSDDINRINLG